MTTSPTEQWRPVTGYEDSYLISDRGRVQSMERTIVDTLGRSRRIPARILARQGRLHYVVALLRDGQRKHLSVARLQAAAFNQQRAA
jgi:hypothetical protein